MLPVEIPGREADFPLSPPERRKGDLVVVAADGCGAVDQLHSELFESQAQLDIFPAILAEILVETSGTEKKVFRE